MTAPTIQVFLDDGSGTYPTSVTGRVDMKAGVSVSPYGRADEFNQASSAQLQLVLDNKDGSLSSGALFSGQGIRFKLTKGATTKNRFTGKIVGGVMVWPGGQGKLADIAVTAYDPLADLGNFEMRSMLEHEILSDAPGAYYPLSEAQGSTSAGDISGNEAAPLTPVGLVGIGAGVGPVDGLPAALFSGAGYLSVDSGLIGTTGNIAFDLTTTAVSVDLIGWLLTSGGVSFSHVLRINSTGHLEWVSSGSVSPASTTAVNDGLPHFIEYNRPFLGGLDPDRGVWIDGVHEIVGFSSLVGFTFSDVRFGSAIGPDATAPFVGTLSHLVISAGLGGSTRAGVRATAAAGFAGDTTDARFARIVAYAGYTSTTTTGLSGQTVGPQVTTGTTALQALQDVATAEGAPMYADGSGVIVLQGRGYRAGKVAADLTLTAPELAADTEALKDNQQQINKVTVSRVGGATQVVGAGLPSSDLSLIDDNDGDALRRAQWIVAKYANPGARIADGTFDPYTSTLAEQLLQREIGDRLAFTLLPSQMWAGIGDVTIEGWSETVTQETWSISVNLLPWSLFTALVLDDPIFGALDAFPIMD